MAQWFKSSYNDDLSLGSKSLKGLDPVKSLQTFLVLSIFAVCFFADDAILMFQNVIENIQNQLI